MDGHVVEDRILQALVVRDARSPTWVTAVLLVDTDEGLGIHEWFGRFGRPLVRQSRYLMLEGQYQGKGIPAATAEDVRARYAEMVGRLTGPLPRAVLEAHSWRAWFLGKRPVTSLLPTASPKRFAEAWRAIAAVEPTLATALLRQATEAQRAALDVGDLRPLVAHDAQRIPAELLDLVGPIRRRSA
ncbi:MAG TPA: hypothetical protein VFS40_14925 [Gemmatimonadales bacterium]|nr:hypothetical protein [Gemmatimonadales bacterium]